MTDTPEKKPDAKPAPKARYVVLHPIYTENDAPPHAPGRVIELAAAQARHLLASGHVEPEHAEDADVQLHQVPPSRTVAAPLPNAPPAMPAKPAA